MSDSMKKKQSRSPQRDPGEQPTDLLFWPQNGCVMCYRARVPADTEVSIGRTDSKRALGFIVSRGDTQLDFVLNRDQVLELAMYLDAMYPALRAPRGRKPPHQLSLVDMWSEE
jgi:hypothetical protein